MRVIYEIPGGCTMCGMCIYECPVGAISMTTTSAQIDPEICIGCGACQRNCASEAIRKLEVKKCE